MFIQLRTHSCYSLLRGLAFPTQLAEAAASSGMPSLGLTDVISLTGTIEFYDACRERQVRPILGLELPVRLDAQQIGPARAPATVQLALLATDFSGWGNLCRLSSLLLDDPENQSTPSVALASLAQHSAGLICLSGNLGQHLLDLHRTDEQLAAGMAGQMGEIFSQRLYLEIQIPSAADRTPALTLARLAHRYKLPCVASAPVYYLHPPQASLQRTLTAIRLNRPRQNLPDGELAPPGTYFVDSAQVEARFTDLPAALENTAIIAGLCQLELPLGELHYPNLEFPHGETAQSILGQRAHQGMLHIYGADHPQAPARLEMELQAINRYGYASLFLIMQDILQFARRAGIPHASRGSAASSLVAHVLGITSPDPLALNLYFERFLNPARAKPPDIDTDLCSRRRDEVIRYVYDSYGRDRVAMVATINRFRRRSALREVGKAYGLSRSAITQLVEQLPERWYGPPQDQAAEQPPFAGLVEQYPDPLYQAIFQDAADLLGVPDHLSIHPGGVVIAPSRLTDFVPTMMAAKGIKITQFDLEAIERMGLVKIDLLGIRGLTVLGDVALARHRHDELAELSALHVLESIPENDPATAACVRAARTIGCFQIESPGMRLTLREVQAHSVEDILVALALFRPGPLTGGLKDEFIRRYRSRQVSQTPIEYLHPSLQPALQETYGVVLYQEQVLRIAHDLGGFTLADADLLRRAMSHFDPGKQMQTLQEKFISGAYQRHAVPSETASRIWEMMAAFAGYGFPKAHAASYAQVAWRSAWCKTHYPALFMASVLANWGGYYSQRVYLTEARRLGLHLHPPHINHSAGEFSLVVLSGQEALFMGLNQVRELTHKTQARINKSRPFHSLADFIERADPRPGELSNLIQVGALDGFGSIPELLWQVQHPTQRNRQLPMFDLPNAAQDDQPTRAADWSLAQKVAAQEQILGAAVTAHPLELFAAAIQDSGALSTVDAIAQPGQRLRVAGMRQTWRRSRASGGRAVYFMSLEDLEGMLDVIIPAEIYRRHKAEFNNPGPYILDGLLEFNPATQEPVLRLERAYNVNR